MKDSYFEELLDKNGWKLEDIDIIQRGLLYPKWDRSRNKIFEKDSKGYKLAINRLKKMVTSESTIWWGFQKLTLEIPYQTKTSQMSYLIYFKPEKESEYRRLKDRELKQIVDEFQILKDWNVTLEYDDKYHAISNAQPKYKRGYIFS